MISLSRELEKIDPEVSQAIALEKQRQANTIDLIASENYTSLAVMEAQGSTMTNKYAEGYPGKRYYGGCEYVDMVERLAIERAKELFGAEHANLQPHSGTQANMAVYFAAMNVGDVLMGLELAHGGHLTHGASSNFSALFYRPVPYTVDRETETINYQKVLELAKEHRPKLLVAGASSYPRILDFEAFRKIADEVGAYLMVDMAHIAGMVAVGLHPSPVPHAHFVTSTTHKTLRGPRGGFILCKKDFASAIDKTIFPGIQGGPSMHIIAAKAVAFKEAMNPEFKQYQAQILANAKALASELMKKGYRLISGGTDTHLMVVDLRPCNMSGLEAEKMLEKANIAVNKNSIPFDDKSPVVTSGIRLGTPSVTSRGMKEEEMALIASLIDSVLHSNNDATKLGQIKDEVLQLCQRFPLPYP